MNNKKKITMLLLIAATATGAYAQGNGMAGINEATKMVTSYFDPGTKLIYAKCTTSSQVVTPIRARPQPLGSVRVSSSLWQPLS